jgi:hypothetical protein
MTHLTGSRWFGVLALLPIVLAAGSCGPARNQFAPVCPIPGLVTPLSELTRYRGASQDIRDLIIRAKINNVVGKCEPGDGDTVLAKAQVVIDLTRGPAMEGLKYELPLFIAVTDADAIRDKTLFALKVEFERNADTARAVSPEVKMELPVTAEKSGAAYGIIAGFQLTPEEITAWRRNNRR